MSYLWIPALPIHMQLSEGQPQAFLWRKRRHQVTWVAQRWRVDTEWWEARVWREYYKLVTDTGLLVVVYEDLLVSGWYLQQVMD